LATFVTQALIQLYARITKLGWFDCQKDDYVFRNAITDVTRFLQVSCPSVSVALSTQMCLDKSGESPQLVVFLKST
jgi:hypothetical protein